MKKSNPFSPKNRLCSCLALLFATFFSLNLQAQNTPAKQWDKTLGGSNEDGISSLQQTSDGGYILGGYSYSGIGGDKTQASQGGRDFWVVKLDANGNKQWDKTFGGSNDDWLTSLQQTSDGGYILGGYSDSGISGDKTQASQGSTDYWVVKLDASGNKTWDKTNGSGSEDNLWFLQQTSDGGYILAGESFAGISGNKTQASQGGFDYWIVKLDASGNKIWDKSFGGGANDWLTSLQQTSDGGYILGGYSVSGINGVKTQAASKNDYWVLKLDASGNKIWDRTIAGTDYDELYSLQQTSDGGYILGGYSKSDISRDKTQATKGGNDYWVVKLDALGNITWDKVIGGSYYDELYSLQQTSDGGYILGGISRSGISGDKSQACKGEYDYWLVKLDELGNKIWDNTLGTSTVEKFKSMRQTSDGGFIVGGYSDGGINGDKSQASIGGNDFWVVKLAAPAPSVPADVAVSAITSANSNCSLSNQETITITVNNIGIATQSNIPVSYKINNGTPVNEVVPGPLAPNTSVSYSFTSKANLSASGTYNIEAKTNLTGDALPINDTFTKAVMAYAVPAAPTITTSGSTLLCTGGTVTLTAASATTVVNYQWFNNGTAIANATSATYTANAAGNYTAKAIVAGNCSSPASAATIFTIKATPPAPTISVTGSLTVCSVDSVALAAVSSVPGATFTWFKNGNVIPGATTATYMAKKAGSYTVTATANGCGSAASPATTLTVNPTPKAPSVNAGGPLGICSGDSVALMAVSSAFGAAFTWFKNGNVIPGATAATYIAKTAGSYSATVAANGCTSTGSAARNVTVYAFPAAPTVTASGSTMLCTGATVKLTAASATTGVDYQWFYNGTAIANANTATYTANAAGSYAATAIVAGKCSSPASAATIITMNTTPPAPTISVSGSLTICSVDSVALMAASSVPGATFTWFKNGNVIPGATAATYMAKKAGSYTLTATANGCGSAASAATTLTVNPTPKAPSVNAGGPLGLCPSDSVALTAVSSASGATFAWFKNGNAIPGAISATYIAKTAGSYTATATSNGCTSNGSGARNVTIKPATAKPTITQAGFVLTSSSSSFNQWYRDNVAIVGATAKKYTTTSNGSYTVIVTDNGCASEASNAVTITNTGINDGESNLAVAVYPNPSNGLFSITLPEGNSYELTVTDLTGNLIKQVATKDKSTQLNINHVARGVYFLKIVGEGKTTMRKLVVE